jgi:hypothetical protein
VSWWRRHRYSVPGVPPSGSGEGWDAYRPSALTGRPVVAAALARAPQRFADLVVEPGSPELALTQEQLLDNMGISTGDGLTWELGIDDEIKPVIDTGPDVVDEDLMVTALEARPGVVWAQHPDREFYEIRLAEPIRADEALALFIDAIAQAHRELARRLHIDIEE